MLVGLDVKEGAFGLAAEGDVRLMGMEVISLCLEGIRANGELGREPGLEPVGRLP